MHAARFSDSSAQTRGELLLVVDCGGSKTAARLLDRKNPHESHVLAEAKTTAANPLSVGFENAVRAMEEALSQVLAQAGPRARQPLRRALLSIAGAANPRVADKFVDWAREKRLADQVAVVSDLLPILAAGTPDCWGVALISGTGSSAFGRAPSGIAVGCGGWGYLLGDEGSGYAIGRAAAQQTLEELEAGEPLSKLALGVCHLLEAHTTRELTRSIYGSTDPRRTIAALAVLVTAGADEDHAAQRILHRAAIDLAALVGRVASRLSLETEEFAIAGAGGVLVHSVHLQQQLIQELTERGLSFTLNLVRDPLAGCVRLADIELSSDLVTWHTLGRR